MLLKIKLLEIINSADILGESESRHGEKAENQLATITFESPGISEKCIAGQAESFDLRQGYKVESVDLRQASLTEPPDLPLEGQLEPDDFSLTSKVEPVYLDLLGQEDHSYLGPGGRVESPGLLPGGKGGPPENLQASRQIGCDIFCGFGLDFKCDSRGRHVENIEDDREVNSRGLRGIYTSEIDGGPEADPKMADVNLQARKSNRGQLQSQVQIITLYETKAYSHLLGS
jgi:hypothetical protein